MTTFAKLNLKDQSEILVLNAPPSFEPEIAGLDEVAVRRALTDVKQVGFSIAFVTKQKEVDTIAKALARKAAGDRRRSTRVSFNRDNGWAHMGEAGFEPVRMVAIDEDWSAVRFRRVEFIKTLTRDKAHIMTAAGKARAGKGR